MARSKGTANLAASLEVLAGAPLDARDVVPTLEDLYLSANFPYKYIGMKVVVQATGDMYILMGNDVTDPTNWKKVGSAPSTDDVIRYNIVTKSTGNMDASITVNKYFNEELQSSTDYGYQELITPVVIDLTIRLSYSDLAYTMELLKTSTTNAAGYKTVWAYNSTVDFDQSFIVKDAMDNVVEGYFNSSDDLFYEDDQYTSAIVGEEKVIYISLDINKTYRYNSTSEIFVRLDEESSGSNNVVEGYFNESDDLFYEDDQYTTAITGASDVIYVALDTNLTYRFDDDQDIFVRLDEGGTGSAELEVAVTSNTAVGAIPSGTTLAQGTSFTEFVQKLLISEVAPTINFSISKSGNVEVGDSYTETLTLAVTNMGSAKKIKSIAWYEGNTLKQTDTIDSTTTGSWTYTMPTATTANTTFKAIVTYTKSDDTDTTVTKTASISFYYKKFYGGVSDLNPSEATVEALTSALATAKGGTYSFTVTAGRICYAYPKTLGALTSIKDGNGFSLFDSFTRTEVDYTQHGNTVTYYRYVLTDATTVSGYSVVFA